VVPLGVLVDLVRVQSMILAPPTVAAVKVSSGNGSRCAFAVWKLMVSVFGGRGVDNNLGGGVAAVNRPAGIDVTGQLEGLLAGT
jgi:hypothetical protein